MIYLAFAVVVLLGLTVVYVNVMRYWGRTNERFEEQPKAKGAVVYVYMDGCGWCERFSPVWASFVDEHGPAMLAAGVRAEKLEGDDPRAAAYGVRSFPTVLFDAGDGKAPAVYDGERTVAGLAAFAAEHGALGKKATETFAEEEEGSGERRRFGAPQVMPPGSKDVVAANRPSQDQANKAGENVGSVAGHNGL